MEVKNAATREERGQVASSDVGRRLVASWDVVEVIVATRTTTRAPDVLGSCESRERSRHFCTQSSETRDHHCPGRSPYYMYP